MESWKKSTCCKSSERSRNTDAEYGFWPGKHRAGCGRNRPSATCDWVNPLARPSENQYPLSSQSIQRLPYGTHGLHGILVPGLPNREALPSEHGIPFKEVDIETTPGAADEVIRRTGKRAIPQFVIDGEWIQPYRPGEGFLYEEMSKRLGIKEGR